MVKLSRAEIRWLIRLADRRQQEVKEMLKDSNDLYKGILSLEYENMVSLESRLSEIYGSFFKCVKIID